MRRNILSPALSVAKRQPLNVRFFKLTIITLALSTLGVCQSVFAAEKEIWLVSTRNLPQIFHAEKHRTNVRFWELDTETNCWVDSTREVFLETQTPEIPTIFVFHGNLTNAQDAINMGFELRQIIEQAQYYTNDDEAYRLVIWSWHADRVLPRMREDIRLKANWSEQQACYLADLTSQFYPNSKIAFVGFSFGGRITMGALHLLAGGTLNHFRLGDHWSPDKSHQTRAVLLAPAFDQFWLTPNCRYSLSLNMVEELLVLYNSSDRQMRFYPLIYRIGGPKSIGVTGVPINTLSSENREKIKMYDMRNVIGVRHLHASYFSSNVFRGQIENYLLFQN